LAADSNERFDPKKYWESRLGSDYSLKGVGYISLGENFNKWFYRVKARVFLKIVRDTKLELDIRRFSVLDIGSGTGFVIELWKKSGAKNIVGSDFTEVVVRNLRKQFPELRFVRLDIGNRNIEEADISINTFDAISALDVLYHIVDDKSFSVALKNIYNLLRPGGFFIYSDNFLHGSRRNSGVHQVSRSLEEISTILHSVGFEIVYRKPQSVIMNYPVDSRSKAKKILWKLVVMPSGQSELYGNVMGAIMYPMDLLLTSLLRESATTEIMVCRKT
jgi:SAM-dependent methyltransferase